MEPSHPNGSLAALIAAHRAMADATQDLIDAIRTLEPQAAERLATAILGTPSGNRDAE